MAVNQSIDPRVRLALANWSEDAPRGAVSTFCAEHEISRKSFYEPRKRAKFDEPASVLEPRSRRPSSSPTRLSEEIAAQAVRVHAALEGLGAGPRADQCSRQDARHGPRGGALDHVAGSDLPPSRCRQARAQKKPRSAWRRFVYPEPNACWQLDATEYVLTGGRKCFIVSNRPRTSPPPPEHGTSPMS